MHVHFVHCEIFAVKHWNITQRCNNVHWYTLQGIQSTKFYEMLTKCQLMCKLFVLTANSVHEDQAVSNCMYFLVSGHFCCLLIIFANSLDPDKDQQKVCHDLDPNCLMH